MVIQFIKIAHHHVLMEWYLPIIPFISMIDLVPLWEKLIYFF